MLTKVKTWFLGLKTWQKVVVGFVAFSFLVAPFSGGAETSAPGGDSGTAPQVTEMPVPTATEMAEATTLLGSSGCEMVWDALYAVTSSALDWSDSIITDADFVEVLEEDVIKYLGAATYKVENADALSWLSLNTETVQKVRVTLIETYNYKRVNNLLASAVTSLSDGMEIYCSGFIR